MLYTYIMKTNIHANQPTIFKRKWQISSHPGHTLWFCFGFCSFQYEGELPKATSRWSPDIETIDAALWGGWGMACHASCGATAGRTAVWLHGLWDVHISHQPSSLVMSTLKEHLPKSCGEHSFMTWPVPLTQNMAKKSPWNTFSASCCSLC